jgi:hypothetical protein
MGFLDTLKNFGSVALAPATGGLSVLGMDENTRSRIPILGPLTGAKSDAEKALLEKQQQMAREAQQRMGYQQDARMNALGQQLLAFNPRNQMIAQMFGPQAAFTPEAMAQMAQGPQPFVDDSVGGYTGGDPQKLAQQREYVRRRQEYEDAEKRRRDMILGNFQAPGTGPAPIAMPQAQPGRRH